MQIREVKEFTGVGNPSIRYEVERTINEQENLITHFLFSKYSGLWSSSIGPDSPLSPNNAMLTRASVPANGLTPVYMVKRYEH